MTGSLFTILTLLSQREDLDLCPADSLSILRPCSFDLRIAPIDPFAPSADRQQCGELQSAVHPLPLLRTEWRKREDRRLSRAGSKTGTFSKYLQTRVCIKHHISRIFPCLTRPLARCLTRALRQLRGSASATPPCGLRLSENLFLKTPHRTRRKRFSEPSVKAPLGLGSGAHSRHVVQECPE